MPRVYVPTAMRPLIDNKEFVEVEAETVRQAIDQLDDRYEGFASRLCLDGKLRPGLSVVIDGDIAPRGIRSELSQNSEVHFLPSLAGG